MHAIVFNLISREFEQLIFANMGSNEGKPVQDRNPRDGGVLSRADFVTALSRVPWTTELWSLLEHVVILLYDTVCNLALPLLLQVEL